MPKTPKVGATVTMRAKGKPGIKFQKGALHSQLGVPQGEKIPASKMAHASSGSMGPVAAKRARFAQNVLSKGRRTAASHR